MTVPLHEGIDALLSGELPLVEIAREDCLRDIQRRSVGFPDVVEAFGFEIKLSDGDGVDLGVAFSALGGGREILARAGRSLASTRSLVGAPQWRRVCEFSSRWVNSESVEFNSVTHVFLEFDTSAGAEALEEPSIFAGISLASQFPDLGRDEPSHLSSGTSSPEGILIRIVEGLLNTILGREERATLSRCAKALPLGSLVLHVGLMPSRPDGVRLHVCVPEHEAAEYLRKCGAEQAARSVEPLLDRYGGGNPLTTIQLGIGGRVGSAIGIEFAAPSALTGAGASKWDSLLGRLTEDGLCMSTRRDALHAWPAKYQVLPKRNGRRCTIHRDLSHVKILLRPDQPLRAKAYLSVMAS